MMTTTEFCKAIGCEAPVAAIKAFAKVRVVNEANGREWIGYATKDLLETIDIHVPTGQFGYKRVVLTGPDYFVEAI